MKLELTPKEGIGPIKLGMIRTDVCAAMEELGHPLCHEKKTLDYFCEHSIQTEYTDDTVSFIGIASDEKIDLIYQGLDLFDMTSKESFALISKGESKEHTYEDYEYLFPDQIVTLWESDSQYDYKGGEERPVWGQIGIGDQRHLNFSIKLEDKTTEPDDAENSGQSHDFGV
jgi:hypothetical protein